MNWIKNILGIKPVNFSELVKSGALILDVRTEGEFAGGHIKGSTNIPVQVLSSKLSGLNRNQVVITCCASGMRSSSAAAILRSNGFTAYNGGSWSSLKTKI